MIRSAISAILVFVALVAHAEPPDDSSAYMLVTVTGVQKSPADTALLRSLATDTRLASISKACKRFDWTPASKAYARRYAAALPPTTLPVVALLRSDGGVVYKASGTNVPSPNALADELIRVAKADRAQNPRTIQAPQPTADPMANDPLANCPCDQPRPRIFPNRPPLADGFIPDSVTLEADVPDSLGYAAAVGVFALIVLGLLGGGGVLFLVALVGMAIVYAVTRR
ncbi:MAG: hypothetical protein AAF958_00840 [Planctomycetota bacterium]